MRCAMILMVSALSAVSAFGQICAGSHLSYIVRDAKGKAIDSKTAGWSFEKKTGVDYSSWDFAADTWRYEKINLAPGIKAVFGKTQWLEVSRQCNFTEPVKLSVTLKGKLMVLTFTLPSMQGQYDDADFLVDSQPFKAGKYKITLSLPKKGRSDFYPASGWKKE